MFHEAKANIYTMRSKYGLFNANVKPGLLYGCEIWKMNVGDNRKLDNFLFKCIR